MEYHHQAVECRILLWEEVHVANFRAPLRARCFEIREFAFAAELIHGVIAVEFPEPEVPVLDLQRSPMV